MGRMKYNRRETDDEGIYRCWNDDQEWFENEDGERVQQCASCGEWTLEDDLDLDCNCPDCSEEE